MEQVLEFSVNHWPMVLSFVALLLLAINIEMRRSGKALTSHQVTAKINSEQAKVIDIRDAKVFKEGHIVEAINVPFIKIESELKKLESYKKQPLIIVCQMGQQSGAALKKLEAAGFEDLARLSGGIASWQSDNLPLVKA